MASDAQRLINISLNKIAQSRTQRGGVSLHRNLLVATVLQKARYIFMEEAYEIMRRRSFPPEPPEEDRLACPENKENYPYTQKKSRKRKSAEWEDEWTEKKAKEEEPLDLTERLSPDSDEEEEPQNGMEIDRITSLVSIFSFESSLSRSVSTPDLCSAQVKEHLPTENQRTFLTMTA